MDKNHPEYEGFLNDVASKVRALKDPFDAFASLFLRIFSGAIGPAKAFGQIVDTLYKTTVLKNGQTSTVQIVVHPRQAGYHYNDLTFSPGELVLRTSTADQVQWRIVGGGRDCEVKFLRSPFRPPETVIRSGMVVTVDPSAQETCYKYTLKSVDGAPYDWPPGGHCPEIIIQR
jgi:hypothetical protein